MAYVSLEELKAHARIDFSDDDDLLESYAEAATNYVKDFLAEPPASDTDASEPLKQAVLMIAADWYNQRETSIDVTLREIPFGARDIINQIRSWNFGV